MKRTWMMCIMSLVGVATPLGAGGANVGCRTRQAKVAAFLFVVALGCACERRPRVPRPDVQLPANALGVGAWRLGMTPAEVAAITDCRVQVVDQERAVCDNYAPGGRPMRLRFEFHTDSNHRAVLASIVLWWWRGPNHAELWPEVDHVLRRLEAVYAIPEPEPFGAALEGVREDPHTNFSSPIVTPRPNPDLYLDAGPAKGGGYEVRITVKPRAAPVYSQ